MPNIASCINILHKKAEKYVQGCVGCQDIYARDNVTHL